MITPEKIKAVMKAACGYAQVPFVRAEQDGMRPTGIFVSYKIINQEEEPHWQNCEEILLDELNPDKAIIRKEKFASATVSITVIAPSQDYETAWQKCSKLKEYFESESAREVYESQKIIPRFVSLQVQDRSAYLETGFETRLGFDIRFNGSDVMQATVNAINLESTIPTITEA